mgnify:CR=1 FL=1
MDQVLDANLDALRQRDPALAERLGHATPHPGMAFEQARRETALGATLTPVGGVGAGVLSTSDSEGASEGDSGGSSGARRRAVALASRYEPLAEARRLAEQVDLESNATFAVLGVGLGYHVAELARRAQGHAVVIAYEPDVAVLRAVIERIDCRDWLGAEHVAVFAGEADVAELTRRFEPAATAVLAGVSLITHPPSRQLHGPALSVFAGQLKQVVAYLRTNIATTLVNATRTCENLLRNLSHYAAGPTINDLRHAAVGRPAVLVSAGPSLARNVHLLGTPGVRDRVVIIAAQTVLKPLLERGVRPHFVTALDYHEISRRFYEGLADFGPFDDVTLVAEPKANAAILDGYPGPVRVCRSGFLDTLLGELARPVDALPAGSTVAHLSYYLARHLGCDPIIMIGQDLGFSDGLYYCPGTAIHDVWASELGPFNTLEMMEWKRIARHRGMLHKAVDVNERPIYSDEQMLTYLRQFERDFAAAAAEGRTLIDATEGGVPKAHTRRMTLAEALQQHATEPLPTLPRVPDASEVADDSGEGTHHADRIEAVAAHLRTRRAELVELRQTTLDTRPLLERMLEHQRDLPEMDRLFETLEKHQRRVAERREAFAVVEALNQIGVFKRYRADRSIGVGQAEAQADVYATQRRQLERDLENLRWLAEGCDLAIEMVDEARQRLVGASSGRADKLDAPDGDAPDGRNASVDPGPSTRPTPDNAAAEVTR